MKSNYELALQEIQKNYERKLDGKLNAIPFGFERFDEVFPGIMQGVVYAVTAATGVSKSQITKNLFVQRPYNFLLNNPDCGLSLKIFWFGLEESKEEFTLSMISNKLYHDTGKLIDTNELLSRKSGVLSEDILSLLNTKEYKDYYERFEKSIEVVDFEYNTYGIYKKIREYAIANGKFYVKDKEVTSQIKNKKHIYVAEDGTEYNYFTDYKANNPDEYVIIVVDHASIVEQSKDESTLHEAMSRLISRYLRKICAKKFNYIPVIVHQQVMDGDDENKFKGAKVTPSLAKLGDNKLVSRDYMVVFGVFAPDRYQIPEFAGYDITNLRDRYRNLMILKNRLGRSNYSTSLAFYGECNQFYELPKSNEMNNKLYDKVRKGEYKS